MKRPVSMHLRLFHAIEAWDIGLKEMSDEWQFIYYFNPDTNWFDQ